MWSHELKIKYNKINNEGLFLKKGFFLLFSAKIAPITDVGEVSRLVVGGKIECSNTLVSASHNMYF